MDRLTPEEREEVTRIKRGLSRINSSIGENQILKDMSYLIVLVERLDSAGTSVLRQTAAKE